MKPKFQIRFGLMCGYHYCLALNQSAKLFGKLNYWNWSEVFHTYVIIIDK